MKKYALPLFSCLLVFALLLGSFSSATAAAGDDPVVTPVSGDMVFTTEVISIASLPGTVEFDQMVVPVGFPDGEAQFEGNGVLVTGFDSGKAMACFTISGTQVGWGGKVGVWNGSKWVLLPTSITSTTEETISTTACATITGGGTYAFIKWVADTSLLPFYLPACASGTYSLPLITFPFTWRGRFFPGSVTPGVIFSDQVIPMGTPVTFELLNGDPIDVFGSSSSGNGTIFKVLGPYHGIYTYFVNYSPRTVTYSEYINAFTYKVSLPNCYIEFNFAMPDPS